MEGSANHCNLSSGAKMKGSIAAILSFGFLVAGSIAANGPKLRIVGGKDARIEDYPYQASLRVRGQHFCGGTIIGPRHILTAGHCVMGKPATMITVHTGMTSSRDIGHSRSVRKITIHEGYKGTEESSHRHDITLIELDEEIKFDETQQLIPLASHQVVGGEKADLTGWGFESDKAGSAALVLQHTMTYILAHADCAKSTEDPIYEEQICAFHSKGIGACNGDSGGPLVVDGELVGVVSWVDGDYCAAGTNEVYTNVYLYRDWIKKHMN